MKKSKIIVLFICLGLISWYLVIYRGAGRRFIIPLIKKFQKKNTVQSILSDYLEISLKRLRQKIKNKKFKLIPEKITLIALKEEKKLELWDDSGSTPVFLTEYSILAASGKAGPKLKEGDRQVPEGDYVIDSLNPNSSYHLSMRINYPSAYDRKIAQNEGRVKLGGNIFIHGKSVSIGCLAIGDDAIEELFCLVALTGRKNIRILICPNDLRKKSPPELRKRFSEKLWIKELYASLKQKILKYSKE